MEILVLSTGQNTLSKKKNFHWVVVKLVAYGSHKMDNICCCSTQKECNCACVKTQRTSVVDTLRKLPTSHGRHCYMATKGPDLHPYRCAQWILACESQWITTDLTMFQTPLRCLTTGGVHAFWNFLKAWGIPKENARIIKSCKWYWGRLATNMKRPHYKNLLVFLWWCEEHNVHLNDFHWSHGNSKWTWSGTSWCSSHC